jgi:hypothetical protein
VGSRRLLPWRWPNTAKFPLDTEDLGIRAVSASPDRKRSQVRVLLDRPFRKGLQDRPHSRHGANRMVDLGQTMEVDFPRFRGHLACGPVWGLREDGVHAEAVSEGVS